MKNKSIVSVPITFLMRERKRTFQKSFPVFFLSPLAAAALILFIFGRVCQRPETMACALNDSVLFTCHALSPALTIGAVAPLNPTGSEIKKLAAIEFRRNPLPHWEKVRAHIQQGLQKRIGLEPDLQTLFVSSELLDTPLNKLLFMHPDGLEDSLLLHLHLNDGDPQDREHRMNGSFFVVKRKSEKVNVRSFWIESIEHREPWTRPIKAELALHPAVIDRTQKEAQAWVDERHTEVLELLKRWKVGAFEPLPVAVAVTPGEENMLRIPGTPSYLLFDSETGLYARTSIQDRDEEEVVYRLAIRGKSRTAQVPFLDEALMMLQSWGKMAAYSSMWNSLVGDTPHNRHSMKIWIARLGKKLESEEFITQLRQSSRWLNGRGWMEQDTFQRDRLHSLLLATVSA